jgi:hypothetical protein
MYSILASPRAVISPLFNLKTPLVAGLFYIAPGVGLISGTTLGGKWADMTVQRYIIKRGGRRIPQDRLHSGLCCFFLLTPCSLVVYGWSLQHKFGGLAVPATVVFLGAAGLMVASSSLNTYCTGELDNINSRYHISVNDFHRSHPLQTNGSHGREVFHPVLLIRSWKRHSIAPDQRRRGWRRFHNQYVFTHGAAFIRC